MDRKTYIAIDLKSFYASVECVERGLEPLCANLVVADESRTEKTICLAVTPSLKSFGIPGRARLFEVVQKVREINAERLVKAPGRKFTGKSIDIKELNANPSLELDYIVAPPRMKKYMEISSAIFEIYMKYVAPEDVHVYSVDEVFIDATQYLSHYKMSARDFTMMLVKDVINSTGITATAGIGENMYLCKIAMDIVAKHMPADKQGVRIAELTEESYRELLWEHKPITDFWRVGPGTAKRLAQHGMYTMGDVALCSVGKPTDYHNEELLYKLFGINAELLIDHAWGWESATIADIKSYRPENNSLSSGQVLSCPYSFEEARVIVMEMTDLLVLDLVEKKVVTDQMVLTVCYDSSCLADPKLRAAYRGPISTDRYGKAVPKPAHGSINLGEFTSSTRVITDAVMELYDRIVDKRLSVRRMYVVANHIQTEKKAKRTPEYEQLDMFTDYEAIARQSAEKQQALALEKKEQEAILAIKKKFGKNAILKGTNLQECSTMQERNGQVGGHKG